MQMRPQFPVGMLNNPQLAMAPFTNPNAYFAPPQFFPFPQGSMQNLNTNNLVQLLAQNALNLPQFLPNGQVGQVNMPNLVQNVNQLLQMQLANSVPQNPGLFVNGQLGMTKGNGVVQQSLDGNGLQHINHNVALTSDFGSPQVQRNQNVFSPGAANSQVLLKVAVSLTDCCYKTCAHLSEILIVLYHNGYWDISFFIVNGHHIYFSCANSTWKMMPLSMHVGLASWLLKRMRNKNNVWSSMISANFQRLYCFNEQWFI